MITCKSASFLVSKKEEGKIGLIENYQLKIHLSICRLCRLFEKQGWLLKNNAPHTHTHIQETLSEEAKDKMKQVLENAL